MEPKELGLQLHHRKVKGEKLSEEEIKQLNDWYAQMDAEESIGVNSKKTMTESELELLRGKVKDAMKMVEYLSRNLLEKESRIEVLRKENEMLRQEVMRCFK